MYVSFVGGQCQKTVQWENFKTDGGTAHTGNGMSQLLFDHCAMN